MDYLQCGVRRSSSSGSYVDVLLQQGGGCKTTTDEPGTERFVELTRSDNEGFTYIAGGLQAKVLHFEQWGNYYYYYY